jgi:hypothetical protein
MALPYEGTAHANSISAHLSALPPPIGGDHADRRLPVLLRLQRLRHQAEATAGRLLRVLLVRFRTMPAGPDRRLLFLMRGRC